MGFIVLLPTIATLYILHLLFTFVDRFLGEFITGLLLQFGLLEVHPVTNKIQLFWFGFEERIPGIGFILMLLIFIGVGYATQHFFGKEALRVTERTFKKIPIAKTIYSTVQQITTAFIQDRTSFQKVVLVEYPRKGLYTIGFLTGETQGEVQEKTKSECVNVFLPTTPNPTSGWLVLVPKEDIILLGMSVEQGLKFIISGGVVVPKTRVYHPSKEEAELEEIINNLKPESPLPTRLKVNIRKKGDDTDEE
jgi:uncharacterized membrane protein